MRDGATQQISVYDLLVGDVMLVETGDILAADGVLFKANNVRQVQFVPVHDTGVSHYCPLKLEHSINAQAKLTLLLLIWRLPSAIGAESRCWLMLQHVASGNAWAPCRAAAVPHLPAYAQNDSSPCFPWYC